MALTTRLLGKSLFNCHVRIGSVPQCRHITFKARPVEPPVEEGYHERNMRLCRPQSPHLTIYKPQLTSMLSITHRCTGMILAGYAGTFAVVSLLSSKPMGEVIQNISQCYPNFFLAFKVGLIFPFTYHFFNGIRHLIWDTGKALSIRAVYISGYLMLLLSIASAAGGIYIIEEFKRIEFERAELLRKAKEEEARALAEELSKKKKKKK